MTLTESRVRKGVLTFGDAPGEDFSCQPTNVHVTPSYDDDGDQIETLCGDIVPPGQIESWILGGTSIQDFDDPQGFLTYCFTHRMETVPFTWQPNVVGAPTWSGNCVIVALEEGGDVGVRIDTDFEFNVSGDLTRVYAAGGSAQTQSAGTETAPTDTSATDTTATDTGTAPA